MNYSQDSSRWWQGGLEARARRWAEAVYARTQGAKPWPPSLGGSTYNHAKAAIVDMLSVSPIGDEMVRACYEMAKAHYEKLASPK